MKKLVLFILSLVSSVLVNAKPGETASLFTKKGTAKVTPVRSVYASHAAHTDAVAPIVTTSKTSH
ncbi:MAG: hypothetical protein P4L22_04630 [Candidatus Babeliales bacterium]|nr:hypothetical protein [Candidatus Babeliales bacterium]